MLDFSSITGFDWDSGNRDKNWYQHQVDWVECEEVFFNSPMVYKPDVVHSIIELRFLVLGKTNAGRHLFLVFTIRNEKIRIISARDMNKNERKAYEKENS